MKTYLTANDITDNPAYYDSLIKEQDAADFLGYSVRALQNWRVRGGGPNFVKVSSRSIRYRRRDLIAWAESLLVANTSQAAAG
ncbi:MAG: helix-turn-helix domain-containing protein [Sneathiella sp.]